MRDSGYQYSKGHSRSQGLPSWYLHLPYSIRFSFSPQESDLIVSYFQQTVQQRGGWDWVQEDAVFRGQRNDPTLEGEFEFCMCFTSYETLHCVEYCCVRWKSTPSWIGHQWEVSGFKQTSSTADKKRALLFYLPSDNLRSLHKRQAPLKAFSLILLLDAAAARAGWPLLGVIHPEQPITFLPPCKKGDARLRILYLGRLGLPATLPLNNTHILALPHLICSAPWHCVFVCLCVCVRVCVWHLSDVLGALYLCKSCGRGVRICATLRSDPRLSSCRGNLANWASPLLLQNARKTRPCTQHPVFITKEFIVITLDNGVSILQTLFLFKIVQNATLPKLSSLSRLINLSLY